MIYARKIFALLSVNMVDACFDMNVLASKKRLCVQGFTGLKAFFFVDVLAGSLSVCDRRVIKK